MIRDDHRSSDPLESGFRFSHFFISCFRNVPESLVQELALAADADHDLIKCNVYSLHGEMDQTARKAAFKTFCGTGSGILVCTSVGE